VRSGLFVCDLKVADGRCCRRAHLLLASCGPMSYLGTNSLFNSKFSCSPPELSMVFLSAFANLDHQATGCTLHWFRAKRFPIERPTCDIIDDGLHISTHPCQDIMPRCSHSSMRLPPCRRREGGHRRRRRRWRCSPRRPPRAPRRQAPLCVLHRQVRLAMFVRRACSDTYTQHLRADWPGCADSTLPLAASSRRNLHRISWPATPVSSTRAMSC